MAKKQRLKVVKVQPNSAGAIALLRGSEVKADIFGRGKRVRDAAGDGFEMKAAFGPDRAGVMVYADTDDARLAEAENRALTRALNAGR